MKWKVCFPQGGGAPNGPRFARWLLQFEFTRAGTTDKPLHCVAGGGGERVKSKREVARRNVMDDEMVRRERVRPYH